MVGHNVLRIGRYFVSLCADSAPKAGNTVGSDLLIKLFKDMKKLLFAFGASAMLVACGGETGSYTLTGTLQDTTLNGKTVYLKNYDNGNTLDSAVVTNGVVEFKGVADTIVPAVLSMADGPRLAKFVLEPGTLMLDAEKGVVKGSATNDKYTAYVLAYDSIVADYRAKAEKLTASGVDEKEAEAQMEELMSATDSSIKDLVVATMNANKDNGVGYYALLEYAYGLSKTELDKALEGTADWIKNSERVGNFKKAAESIENTAPGKMFTDFTVTDETGKSTKLSDYVGKGEYVLADFWASWCGPCIREMAGLKEIYKKYNGKGLKVIGIAVWDEPQNTRDAIKRLELPWDIMVNGQKEPTEIYGIMGIPHIIMFAPDGTIVFRGLQGEELHKEVDKVMAKK